MRGVRRSLNTPSPRLFQEWFLEDTDLLPPHLSGFRLWCGIADSVVDVRYSLEDSGHCGEMVSVNIERKLDHVLYKVMLCNLSHLKMTRSSFQFFISIFPDPTHTMLVRDQSQAQCDRLVVKFATGYSCLTPILSGIVCSEASSIYFLIPSFSTLRNHDVPL